MDLISKLNASEVLWQKINKEKKNLPSEIVSLWNKIDYNKYRNPRTNAKIQSIASIDTIKIHWCAYVDDSNKVILKANFHIYGAAEDLRDFENDHFLENIKTDIEVQKFPNKLLEYVAIIDNDDGYSDVETKWTTVDDQDLDQFNAFYVCNQQGKWI